MLTKKVIIDDKIVDVVNTVIDLIRDFKYEEAYIYFLDNAKTSQTDPIFKEWIKALCEFYSYNKKEDAINILETVKSEKIDTKIDFYIYNTLLDFYTTIQDKKNFYETATFLLNYMENTKCVDTRLKIIALYNMANGYYEFENYKNAIIYSGRSIDEAVTNQLIFNTYALSLIVRIKAFYKLNHLNNAKSELLLFEDYKYLIGNIENELEEHILELQEIEKVCLSNKKK